MNKRVVITGINGFVGYHLTHHLAQNGHSIIGIGREPSIQPDLVDAVNEYHMADLAYEWPDIQDVDAVIHLAGLAAVGPSFDAPQKYINLNSAMVTHMCEYFLKHEKKPRIIMVSSGGIYDPQQQLPITEQSNIGFTSPYAVSKILTENQCQYYRNRGLECVIVRPFNHIGPRQAPGFILPDFYERLSKAGPHETIKVGNIATKRDYTDVRDIVDGYTRLALAPKLSHTLYNLCSGKSLSGLEILDMLKKAVGKPNVQFEIDPALVRPTDVMDIYGDASRLHDELGWQTTHTIEQTVKDFVAEKQSS
jgi:GDP-4-dehydro-6-deoxy-D-mannose reductase